ncbi:MAG: hypothetical protein R3213_07835 [Flavobacteriaceae bacterium]|nr:hypothetical protein [Flavobacteriaceae bacterium]
MKEFKPSYFISDNKENKVIKVFDEPELGILTHWVWGYIYSSLGDSGVGLNHTLPKAVVYFPLSGRIMYLDEKEFEPAEEVDVVALFKELYNTVKPKSTRRTRKNAGQDSS